MRNKLVIIATLLVVMAGMAGNAAAVKAVIGDVRDANGNLVEGAEVRAYADETFDTPLGNDVLSTFTGYSIILPSDYNSPTVIVRAIKGSNSGTATGTIILEYTPDNTFPQFQTIIYLGNIGFSIPEFPTVAAPIAAVLGLVFFFQQRKNKEE